MRANGRRVPDVIVGGAPRSGTTLSCELLAWHPDIHVLRPFIPEPKVCLADLGDEEAYLDRYEQLFAHVPEAKFCIEKTSNYWENDEARQRLSRLLPDTRFVFILREPVARAYSNWRWSTQNGLETLPFEDAFDRSDRTSPLPPSRRHARPFDYLPRSQYGRLAELWIDAVGRDRIKFYLFEQATKDLAAWAEDLFRYVGAQPIEGVVDDVGIINAAEIQTAIAPDLERKFKDTLRPETEHFASLTGLDVSAWGY